MLTATGNWLYCAVINGRRHPVSSVIRMASEESSKILENIKQQPLYWPRIHVTVKSWCTVKKKHVVLVIIKTGNWEVIGSNIDPSTDKTRNRFHVNKWEKFPKHTYSYTCSADNRTKKHKPLQIGWHQNKQQKLKLRVALSSEQYFMYRHSGTTAVHTRVSILLPHTIWGLYLLSHYVRCLSFWQFGYWKDTNTTLTLTSERLT